MRSQLSKHLTYTNVMVMLIVFTMFGGVAWAAVPRNSVGTKQIKNRAVRAADIKKNTITGAHIREGTLAPVPRLRGMQRFDRAFNAQATGGANAAAARSAASSRQFMSQGPFRFDIKCYSDAAGNVYGDVFIRVTSAGNGSIFRGPSDSLAGGNAASDFLRTNTPENDRIIDETSQAAGFGEILPPMPFAAAAPNGTKLSGQIQLALNNGPFAAGNGVYGGNDRCLVWGHIIAS